MTFGKKMKKIRVEKGLSQQKLGEKMGVKQQTVAQYERAIHAPKYETVKKIADALDCTIPDLCGYDIVKINYDSPERLKKIRQEAEALSILQKRVSGGKVTEEERKKLSDYFEHSEERHAELLDVLGDFKESTKRLKKNIEDVLSGYKELNDIGQQKVIDYIEDLSNIPEYRKEPPQDESPTE